MTAGQQPPSGAFPTGSPSTAQPYPASAYPAQPHPSQHFPAQPGQQYPGHGGAQAFSGPTDFWQRPGAMLPTRTWQRKTRTPVIIATVLGVTLLTAIGVLAVLRGSLTTPVFLAKGTVVAECSGTELKTGSAVDLYDETGDRLGSGRLGPARQVAGGCAMTFQVDDVDATRALYVVEIGGAVSRSVTGAALSEGAVIRLVGE